MRLQRGKALVTMLGPCRGIRHRLLRLRRLWWWSIRSSSSRWDRLNIRRLRDVAQTRKRSAVPLRLPRLLHQPKRIDIKTLRKSQHIIGLHRFNAFCFFGGIAAVSIFKVAADTPEGRVVVRWIQQLLLLLLFRCRGRGKLLLLLAVLRRSKMGRRGGRLLRWAGRAGRRAPGRSGSSVWWRGTPCSRLRKRGVLLRLLTGQLKMMIRLLRRGWRRRRR